MDLDELYKFAYVKEQLSERYQDVSSVPREFLMDWLKDYHDYQRTHSDDELREFLTFTPEQVLNWLEEAAILVWEAKKHR